MTLQFDQLQGEIKMKIFSLLSPVERQVIRPVCLDWKELIDEEFGIKLRVNNGTADILVNSAKYAVELELNSLTVPVDGNGMIFAHKLHTLRFQNIVVTYNLFPLLKNFANSLVSLSFYQIIVDLPDQLQSHALSTRITLPCLKELEIQEWNMSDSLVALLEFLNSAVTYGSLSKISLFLHNPPMMPLQLLFIGDITTAPPLLQLVKKCERTLDVFKYGRQNNVIKLKFYPYPLDNNSQLQEFICNPQFKNEWLPILAMQTKLIKIHIGDCRVGIWDGLRTIIMANSQTLETFWIAGQSFNQHWDCNVFTNCNHLRKLCVQLYMSPKIHLSSIPSTLTQLNISGAIKRHELEHLTMSMTLLEEAEFTHLGINQAADSPEDRMDLTLFKRFLRLPKLTKISFLHCDLLDQEWEDVIQWCSTNTTRGLVFEVNAYPMHGQPIRHGIHVFVPSNFDRSQIDVNFPDSLPRAATSSQDMCHTIFSALTCWFR